MADSTFRAPKGTRDILWPDSARWRALVDAFADVVGAAGYTQVHELEHDDGVWEADVTRKDGTVDEVIIDDTQGEIFDPRDGRAVLDAGQILALAGKAGLTQIESIERDGATWTLDARNARNQRVEVRMSGYDGRVLASKRDGWWD